jgi:hypothetical protein
LIRSELKLDMELSREYKLKALVHEYLYVEKEKRILNITKDEWNEAVNDELMGKMRGKNE